MWIALSTPFAAGQCQSTLMPLPLWRRGGGAVLFLILAFSLPVAQPAARCPNDCSGENGVCQDGACLCAAGFLPPDCSRSIACPNNVRAPESKHCAAPRPRCVARPCSPCSCQTVCDGTGSAPLEASASMASARVPKDLPGRTARLSSA